MVAAVDAHVSFSTSLGNVHFSDHRAIKWGATESRRLVVTTGGVGAMDDAKGSCSCQTQNIANGRFVWILILRLPSHFESKCDLHDM